jgi:MFS family permease
LEAGDSFYEISS